MTDVFDRYEATIIRRYNAGLLTIDKAQRLLRKIGVWEQLAIERGLIEEDE